MRDQMRIQEDRDNQLSERRLVGDQLFEIWSKKKGVGEGLLEAYDANPDKIRGLCYVLENQQNFLKKLTEDQTSSTFSTTPQNVMRIVRLGYPNSVRGEIFLDWSMQTARDSIFYLAPVIGSSKRGAVKGSVTHETAAYNYPSERDSISFGETGGVYTGSTPFAGEIRPYTITIMKDGLPIASDDGQGNLNGDGFTEVDIDYVAGTVKFTYAGGQTFTAEANVDTEVSSNYEEIGEIELQLRDHQFRARPFPLGVSWTKMTELLLGTTLDIDAEDALVRGAADELKKSLDFSALKLGYKHACKNPTVDFNADWSGLGAASEMAHAQSIVRSFDKAGDAMFDDLQRGGTAVIYGGPNATSYLKLANAWENTGRQPAVGGYKLGEFDGMPVYKAPSSIVPTDELVCVYKNPEVPEDVAVAFGTLIPLYKTNNIEFRQMYTETGLAHFGDAKVLQGKYLRRIKISNL